MKKESTSVRLKRIMAERGVRQVDVLRMSKPICEKWGVKLGSNDLSQYVTGKVEPSQRKLSVLAETLGTNEAWLMGYDVEKEVNSDETNFENIKKTINETNCFSEENKKTLIDMMNYFHDLSKKEKE